MAVVARLATPGQKKKNGDSTARHLDLSGAETGSAKSSKSKASKSKDKGKEPASKKGKKPAAAPISKRKDHQRMAPAPSTPAPSAVPLDPEVLAAPLELPPPPKRPPTVAGPGGSVTRVVARSDEQLSRDDAAYVAKVAEVKRGHEVSARLTALLNSDPSIVPAAALINQKLGPAAQHMIAVLDYIAEARVAARNLKGEKDGRRDQGPVNWALSSATTQMTLAFLSVADLIEELRQAPVAAGSSEVDDE
jgi:hypothetical protein